MALATKTKCSPSQSWKSGLQILNYNDLSMPPSGCVLAHGKPCFRTKTAVALHTLCPGQGPGPRQQHKLITK